MFEIFKKFTNRAHSNILSQGIADNAFLVDVRTAEEFAEGSAAGAINIPLDKMESQLSKFKSKNDIVVFCRSGNRSGMAKKILEINGYQNVINGGSLQDVQQALNN